MPTKANSFRIGLIILPLLLLLMNTALSALTIADNGASTYSIVLSDNASLSEIYGARELQKFIQIISGAYLPIAKDNEDVPGPKIYVGFSRGTESASPGIDSDGFGDEEFIIRTAGEHLLLAGGRLRGSMYAVFTFLEKYLGCRWYSPDASYIPELSAIAINEISDRQKPAFESRETYWYEAHDPDWAARNKNNVYRQDPDVQKGEDATYAGTHTFYRYVPPENYFEDHPEYFAILADKREWRYSQLCLTNPELCKLASRRVLEWMGQQLPGTVAWVGQNDWHVYCICGHCASLDEKEESHSGTLIHFVNFIGERVAREYPKRKIGTLAYTYTEKPPKYVRPLDNVVIRLALIYGCEAHPVEECDINTHPRENLKNWAPLVKNLWVWDYVTNFAHYLIPFPIWQTNQKDLIWYRDMGVDGIKEQGCTRTRAAAGSQLIAYLETRLLWNPEQDREAIIRDFLKGYYGDAAEPIRQYMALLEDRTLDDRIHFTLYSPPTTGLFTPGIIQKADEYLNQAAEAVTGDPARSYRVEEVKMNMMYVKLAYPVRHVFDGILYKPALDTPPYATLANLNRFIELCRKHGMDELREARGYDWTYNFLRANLSTHKIVSVENPDIRLDIIPGIGGRIARMTHKTSGKNYLRVPGMMERYYPAAGGYVDSPAGTESFDYTLDTQSRHMTLEGYVPYREVPDALKITRDMYLPPEGPQIEITTSMECLKQLERPIRLQTIPDLDMGDISQLKAGVRTPEGNIEFRELTTDEEGNTSLTLLKRDIQAGEWIVINKATDTGFINTFDPEGVEECQFSTDRKTGQAVMSLRGIQKIMKPGEKLIIKQSMKIVTDISTAAEY